MIITRKTQRLAIRDATRAAIDNLSSTDSDEWQEAVALVSGDTLLITAHRGRKQTTKRLIAGWILDGWLWCSKSIEAVVHSGR